MYRGPIRDAYGVLCVLMTCFVNYATVSGYGRQDLVHASRHDIASDQ